MGLKLMMSLLFSFSYVAQAKNGSKKLVSIQTDNPGLITQLLKQDGYEVDSHGSSRTLHVETESLSLLMLEPYIDPNQVTEVLENEPLNMVDSVAEYYNPEQVVKKLMELETNHPKFAKVFNLTEWLKLPKTQEGSDLFALQISENPDQVENEIKILMIGQHHAREIMTHHAVLDAAEEFLTSMGKNSEYSEFVKKGAIWFVPVMNVDGLNHVFTENRNWRKNRAVNSDGSFGVDLNRNYEFKWGECGNNSNRPSSQVYRGETPNSEPEVQVMDQLNNKLRAQFLISYHSSGNEVLYPFICGDMAETEIYYGLRDRLATHLEFGKRVASSSGEDFEHHYARYGSLGFLLEIGTSFQPSMDKYKTTVWPRVQKVLPFLIEESKKAYLNLKVVNKGSEPMANVPVKVEGIEFRNGETRTTDEFGVIRWYLPEGKHKVEIGEKSIWTGTLSVESGSKEIVVTLD